MLSALGVPASPTRARARPSPAEPGFRWRLGTYPCVKHFEEALLDSADQERLGPVTEKAQLL